MGFVKRKFWGFFNPFLWLGIFPIPNVHDLVRHILDKSEFDLAR